MIECPLCHSNEIKCTDLETKELEITKQKQTNVRFYCSVCKKGMTITGVLVSTAEEVKE